MIFLNNRNKFFMSRNYSADQGGSGGKGVDGASNGDSVVSENNSDVVDVEVIRSVPIFPSAIERSIIADDLKEDQFDYLKEFTNALGFKISEKAAFSKAVPKAKSGGEELDASDSKAGQKGKKSESLAKDGGLGNLAGGFSACRSKGLGGVGGSSSNGAGARNNNIFNSSNSRDASDSQAGKKRRNTSESLANDREALNPAGGFSAVRIRFSNVGRFGGVGGSSSNGAGATNSGGVATSSSPFDTSPILQSQHESNRSRADLAKAKKLHQKIVRELRALQPFRAYVNQGGSGHNMILRSTLNIDMPVDPSWTSLNPNVNQSQVGQKRKKIESPENKDRDPNPGGVFRSVRSRSSNAGGLGGVGGSSSNGAKGGSSSTAKATATSQSPAPAPSPAGADGVGEEKNSPTP